MLYSQQLILSALSAVLVCSATKVLPRAQHAAAEPGALIEISNVMLGAGTRPSPRNAPILRSWDRRSVPIRDASSESPLAAIKKTLLHKRQLTCDAGYGLCNDAQGGCCPIDGKCCNGGYCAASGQICCSGGGTCDSGYKCCGSFQCAPSDAQCCSGGSYCARGLNCVIIKGVQGCCVDLSCTAFDSDGPVPTIPSFTYTPISVTLPSIPSITFTPISITPISFTPISITPISVPPVSIPQLTLPTPVGADHSSSYSYYTTTWIWYYYTYFLTTIPPSFTRPTSTEVTTTLTTFSVYATDIADADSQFDSVTAAVTLPTAVTAPAYASAAASPSSSSSSAFSVGGLSTGTASSGNSGAAASGGVKGDGGFGMLLLLGSCLAIGIGFFAIWL